MHIKSLLTFIKIIINDFALNNFKDDLDKMNWSKVMQCSCPNESFNLFLHEFTTLYRKHFLVKKICGNKKHVISPYITPALKKNLLLKKTD